MYTQLFVSILPGHLVTYSTLEWMVAFPAAFLQSFVDIAKATNKEKMWRDILDIDSGPFMTALYYVIFIVLLYFG